MGRRAADPDEKPYPAPPEGVARCKCRGECGTWNHPGGPCHVPDGMAVRYSFMEPGRWGFGRDDDPKANQRAHRNGFGELVIASVEPDPVDGMPRCGRCTIDAPSDTLGV